MKKGKLVVSLGMAIALCGAAWAGTSTTDFNDGTFGCFPRGFNTENNQTTIQNGQAVITCTGWSTEGLVFNQVVAGDFSFDITCDLAKSLELTGTLTDFPVELYTSLTIGGVDVYQYFVVISSATEGTLATVDPVNGLVYSTELFDPTAVSLIKIHIERSASTYVMTGQYDDDPVITLSNVTGTTEDLTLCYVATMTNTPNGSMAFDDLVVSGPNVLDYPAAAPEVTCNVDPATIVAGANVTLTAPEGSEFKWFKDGAEMTGETGQVLEFGSIQEGDEGVYTCEFNDGTGTVTTAPITLVVAAAPVGDLPAASILGLGILITLCGASGMRSVKGRK